MTTGPAPRWSWSWRGCSAPPTCGPRGRSASLRENERGTAIGMGWDPNWHQPTDVYAAYHGQDFGLGLNAAQTTLAGVAQLVGATIKN